MKKSLRRKLLLSGLAMGVAALSLASTTYAWFTNNTKVDTTEINASVALNNSLYIKSGDDQDWSTRATLPGAQTLNPVHWDGTKMVDIDGEAANQTDYYHFTLQFKVDQKVEGEDLKIKLTEIVVDGGLAKDFKLKASAGGSTTAGTDVAVSPLDSLYFVFDDKVHAYNSDATAVYQDGLIYYNNIMNKKYDRAVNVPNYKAPTENYRTDDAFATIKVGKTESNIVNCYVYLEGWDKDNFDAICGNGFELSFEFAI